MITVDPTRIAQEQELLRARVEVIEQTQAVLDERQRKEMLSLTRAFLLVDQVVTELRKQLDEFRKADAEQDMKLVQAETLLNEVRIWIKTAVAVVASGFVVVVVLLFVIALQR